MSIPRTFAAATLIAAFALGEAQTPSILPNDGLVGGADALGVYQFYLVPGLGTAAPGAPVPLGISSALAQRMNHFVIDQANSQVIATAAPAVAGGPIEIWRISLQGSTVLAETQLTVLSGTNNMDVRSMRRDASGCIFVLCRPNVFGGTFTVHRVAVTRQGALAFQVPITTPNSELIDAIDSDAQGQILLGGTAPPYNIFAPGVTLSVSQAGGMATVTNTIASYHVISVGNRRGVVVAGLSPQQLPPAANFWCNGTLSNYQYNSGNSTTLWTDIELNPAGTQYVLVGSGAAALGGNGVMIQIPAVGCGGAPTYVTSFSHGLDQVAIAFASQNYGCGCPPSTNVLPQIAETGPPIRGASWVVLLVNGVPNSTAVLITGRNDKFYLGNPLPQPLSLVGGQSSCFLLDSMETVSAVQTTDNFGSASNTRSIPNNPALIGTAIYSQWLVYETTSGVPPFSTAGLVSIVQ